MRLRLITGIFLTLLIALSSCKAKKELAVSQEHVQRLQSDSITCMNNLATTTSTLNARIADLTNQVNTLSSQNAALSHDAEAYRQLKDDLNARQARLNAALAEQGTSLKEIRKRLLPDYPRWWIPALMLLSKMDFCM